MEGSWECGVPGALCSIWGIPRELGRGTGTDLGCVNWAWGLRGPLQHGTCNMGFVSCNMELE